MAYAKITFEHPEIGTIRKSPVGFSSTLLWIGPIVALVRRDLKGFLILAGVLFLTSGVSWLIAPFFYNKLYIKRLMKKGYKVTAVEGSDIATLRKKLEINLPQK
jgi:hypothetical protein